MGDPYIGFFGYILYASQRTKVLIQKHLTVQAELRYYLTAQANIALVNHES